ncbi:MAG: adenine phosphoribosyltransferase [Candidatus Wallbacteria bacterium]|nr:adenine phosphoribosyltransferase [Candidatus Wallbacteria bacterium]
MENWTALIRDIPDFPKKGILFKDITPLLLNPDCFAEIIREMHNALAGLNVSAIAAAESRGFIFGAPLAHSLKLPFIPVRKPGKLPAATHSVTYDLEYGQDTVCIHTDALKPGQRVALIDDLLATGGTAAAMEKLVSMASASVVTHLFLIELSFLEGRKKLAAPVKSFISY